jgi:hypothetical protein
MKITIAIALAAAATTATVPTVADWRVSTGNDVVVTLSENPASNAERACLAVTLARVLQTQTNVTLFPTLDGVALADASVVRLKRFRCETPFGTISLKENLEAFLAGNPHNMVICPLCYTARYGDEAPGYGYLPPPGDPAVVQMFLSAAKVIDF